MALLLKLLCFVSLIHLHAANEEAVVFVVDPDWDCVESYVANIPLLHEYKIIKVMTRLGQAPVCNSDRASIYKNITFNSWTPNDSLATAEICPQLQSVGMPIAAVIPTFDPAVYLADRLAACLGVRGNPSTGPLWNARRNKLAMSEAVSKAGLRSVKEKVVSRWSEANDYINSLSPPLSHTNPVIFKILEGSSSMGVAKIYSLEQAKAMWFSAEYADVSSILIQECFQGKEYVIDSVSRDGVHKVVMVYHEDLRPGNGIFNLYYGFKTMDPKEEKTKAIIEYANKVLDATDLQNGAADMEVFWIEDEGRPCVTDLNARWTGTMWHDGLALEKALAGHDQITATMTAYLDVNAFNEIPAVPSMQQHGALIFARPFHTGVLQSVPGLAVAEESPSYHSTCNDHANVGSLIEKCIIGRPPITILLAHKDKDVLDADYNRIIDLEYSNAFYDITPLAGYKFSAAPRLGGRGVRGQTLLVIASVGTVAFAVAFFIVAKSRLNAPDDTEYLTLE